MLVIVVVSTTGWLPARSDDGDRAALRLGLAVSALALLGKMVESDRFVSVLWELVAPGRERSMHTADRWAGMPVLGP
jgi:hypothetical protein